MLWALLNIPQTTGSLFQVLQNSDELFEREELSAAPDVGWPDCFNSGVFVYRPSLETYDSLIQFALERGSFDGKTFLLLSRYLMILLAYKC